MHRLRRLLSAAATVLTFAAALSAHAQQQPNPLTPNVTEERVTEAIRKGVDYLLAQQKDGNWEAGGWGTDDMRYGGTSCLALYSLLHVGQSLDDPRLKPRSPELAPAVNFVSKLNPTGTYTASLQASVLALLPRTKENTQQLTKLRDLLVASQLKDGGHAYYVVDPKRNGAADNSNSQYAVLGLWAISDADIPVPSKYWIDADKYWRAFAQPDGGWPYNTVGGSTMRMTSAGMSSLYVIAEYMDSSLRLDSKPDPVLDAGMAYLTKHFADTIQRDPGYANGYFLYGVERVGLASGRKFLGTTNWFAEGAAYILSKQGPEGEWNWNELGGSHSRISTPFALLFLARGRNPVVFNKLEYQGPWDARRRDATNLTNWMAHQFERPINWQVVNMDVSHEEWLDAPVLLITGSKDPRFTLDQVAKLRRFVNEGGLIFSTADGASSAFTAACQRYAETIAENKYPWRNLPADHEVFKVYQTMKAPPPLMGLSNGIRELWIHSPEDLGATWQLKQHTTEKDKKKNDFSKERPWDLAANVFFYANGRGTMRSKLQTTAIAETTARPTRSLTLARLKYAGNWDPEPGSFDRLRRIAFNRWNTSLDLKTVDLDDLASAPKDVAVLYMTGTEKFTFTPDQRAILQKFLDSGGILLADAANTSKDFDKSFQTLVHEQLYPAGKWDVLDNRSTLFLGSLRDTQPITKTHLRPATITQYGDITSPRIYALVTADRSVRVIYSPFDLTVGLLGTTTTGFSGYTPASAEDLLRNALLYANAAANRK